MKFQRSLKTRNRIIEEGITKLQSEEKLFKEEFEMYWNEQVHYIVPQSFR